MKTIKTVYKEDDDKIHYPLVLLKFGELSHLKQLLENGTIYLSSISDIRESEKKQEEAENFRNDPVEGAIHYVSGGPAQATFSNLKAPDGNPLSISILNITYYEKPKFVFGNICSFYGITIENLLNNELAPIDLRMKKFGGQFIIITDFAEFVKRIDKAVENASRTPWEYGFVKYFDEKNYRGNLHPFKKRSRYSFQNEFRLHFKTNDTSAIKVNIGSIRDIAGITNSDVLEFLKVKLDANNSLSVNWLKPTT